MRMRSVMCAAAVLTMSGAAVAGFDNFTVHSVTSATDGAPIEDFSIASYAWGSTNFIDNFDDDQPGVFHIEVNSGASQRPGFDHELSLNYANYDIGFFFDGSGPGTHLIELLDIVDDGSISGVFVKDVFGNAVGNFSTDGNSIFFDATVEEILAVIGANEADAITIQFAMVPAPGAFAMLGLAGLAGRRRRRN